MSAQTSGLKMFAAEQLAFDHGHATDTRTQCHHHYIREAASCACEVFAQKRHSRIVLEAKGKAKFFAAPAAEIDTACVVVFSMRRQRPRSARIDNTSNSHRNSRNISQRETVVLDQVEKGIADSREHCIQALCVIGIEGVMPNDSAVFDQATGGMRASEIDG
jgi:hypothetical protein